MATKNYVSLSKLSTFLDNLKNRFETKADAQAKLDEAKLYTEEFINTANEGFEDLIARMYGNDIYTLPSIREVAQDEVNSIIPEVDNKINTHNTSTTAHQDIRDAVTTAQNKANDAFTLADSKAPVIHNHDDLYYTESEIDTKVSTINASINNIENGTTVVAKANHSVNADNAVSADLATKAVQDGDGNIIKDTYETKASASSKLTEAKSYADGIKNDLLNGAGGAYDTLKELGDLIDDNTDAIDALNTVAASKANASDLVSHIDNKSNPHGVTAAQVGLGNVPNVATNDQTPTYTQASTLATLTSGEKLSVSFGKIMKAISDLISHIGNKSNPHGVTLTQLGVNATATELNYVDGVTSNIQTQLNGKASNSVATTSANGLMSSTDKAKLDATNVAFANCNTAAATSAKVATVSGNNNWALTVGCIVMVKFTNSNTAESVTLNVNNTGAYPIWYNDAEYVSTGTAYTGYAGRTITYSFSGTHWVWISGSYDANTQSNTNTTNKVDTKLFLAGATSQGSSKTTYSNKYCYVGVDNSLYSYNSTAAVAEKVVTTTDLQTAIGDAIAASY